MLKGFNAEIKNFLFSLNILITTNVLKMPLCSNKCPHSAKNVETFHKKYIWIFIDPNNTDCGHFITFRDLMMPQTGFIRDF